MLLATSPPPKKQEAHGPHRSPEKTVFKSYRNVDLEKKKKHYLVNENFLALHLKKLESLSPKDSLCQVWLKIAQWFCRRKFFNFVNVFSMFRNYLPLEKGLALHLN